ncbi:hypothetical protein EPN42_04685 [bacterium]|nr:MAG: hypothetical protein EPN42_04685 [bacterium]
MILIGIAVIGLVVGATWAQLGATSYDGQLPGMRGVLYVAGGLAIAATAALFLFQAAWSVPVLTYALPLALLAGGLRFGGFLSRKLFVSF